MENLIHLLREKIKIGESAIRLAYFQNFNAHEMKTARTDLIDSVLCALFDDFKQKLPSSFMPALVAIGGYARKDLFPHSDIDLLVLIPNVHCAQTHLENFVAKLWDLNVKMAHRVGTINEALESAKMNTATQTALLEGRFLSGNQTLFLSFQTRLRAMIDPIDFLRIKRFEQKERHQRFNNTPYNLEPNIKESPGALRDLHVILWLANIAGVGKTFVELNQNALLSDEGLKIVQQAENFLSHLRIRLHYLTHKAEDRLLFDYQEELAKSFHWQGQNACDSASLLMQHYYQNAKVVMLLGQIVNQSIFNACAPEHIPLPEKIDDDFQIMDDSLDVIHPLAFQQNPSLIFKSFLKMQELTHLSTMSAATLRALWQARFQINENFRQNPVHQAQFLQLLCAPKNVARELIRLNELELLGAYIPSFQKIVGQMQYDLFHAYTVDQHSFQLCKLLENLRNEELAYEYPLLSRLMRNFDKPAILFLAALFHDIAKGRGGDHAELGAQDARDFCILHALPQEDADFVVWLVHNHLKMSLTAQKEDLSLPETIEHFAHWVGDLTHLNALYLLTHADIRATNPKIWNTWKAKLLEELYIAAQNFLLQKEKTPMQGVVEMRKANVLKALRYFALPYAIQNGLWKTVDDVYFMRHSEEELIWHLKTLHYQKEKNVVASRWIDDALEVLIFTPDSPDLFTHLVGFFARQNFNVLDAKIHTTSQNLALDSFVLLPNEKPIMAPKILKNTNHLILKMLKNPNKKMLPILHTRLPRQLRYFPLKTDIMIKPDENKLFYRFYITTSDQPGLLYLIANTFKKFNIKIHSARIITMGERAEDVFLISAQGLNDENFRLNLERAVMEAVKL